MEVRGQNVCADREESNVEAGSGGSVVRESASHLPVVHSVWDSLAVDYDNIAYALKGGGGKKKKLYRFTYLCMKKSMNFGRILDRYLHIFLKNSGQSIISYQK